MVFSSQRLRSNSHNQPAAVSVSSFLTPHPPDPGRPPNSTWDIFNEYAENREDVHHHLQRLSTSPNAHWTLTSVSDDGRFPTTFQELEKIPVSDIVDGFIDSRRFNTIYIDPTTNYYSDDEILISRFSPDVSEPPDSPNFVLRLPLSRSRRGSRNKSGVYDSSEDGGVKQTVLLAAHNAGKGVGRILSSLSSKSANMDNSESTEGSALGELILKSVKKSHKRKLSSASDMYQPMTAEILDISKLAIYDKELPPDPPAEAITDEYLHSSPGAPKLSKRYPSENDPPQPEPTIPSPRRSPNRRFVHQKSPSESQFLTVSVSKGYLLPPSPNGRGRVPLPPSPNYYLRSFKESKESPDPNPSALLPSAQSTPVNSDKETMVSVDPEPPVKSPNSRFYHHKSPSEPNFSISIPESRPKSPVLSLPTSPTCRLPNPKRAAIRLASNIGDGKRHEWDPNALLEDTLYIRPRRPPPPPLVLNPRSESLDRSYRRPLPNRPPVSPRSSSMDDSMTSERQTRLPGAGAYAF